MSQAACQARQQQISPLIAQAARLAGEVRFGGVAVFAQGGEDAFVCRSLPGGGDE
jgi:hypothetical protein